ncbi:hypothetical protein GCM10007981_03720 [Thermocladium modestius]|uniref:Uncharacterized protein n=1 Tax=Thermocladium modestius TaxID=62609 RepID=A0A830GRH8_9CREN|nr:hypothetical protein GCM10007981_03720 [Thermocladium modestius]
MRARPGSHITGNERDKGDRSPGPLYCVTPSALSLQLILREQVIAPSLIPDAIRSRHCKLCVPTVLLIPMLPGWD